MMKNETPEVESPPKQITTDVAVQTMGCESLSIAPWWHTVVLVAAILAISWRGSMRVAGAHGVHGRLWMYGSTALMELALLGWVALGLWLRKVPFRTLFGKVERGVRGLATDVGAAAVFWIVSMMVLGSLGLAWNAVEFAATHKGATPSAAEKMQPSEQQKKTLQTLERMAPAGGAELAAWVALCLLVGPVEEAIFRGYLQRQFTAGARGRVAVGIAASALIFGGAHGYEGVRTMVLLTAFGALFSMLAWIRGGLRAGIFAHSAHDLIVGLLLAAARSHHVF